MFYLLVYFSETSPGLIGYADMLRQKVNCAICSIAKRKADTESVGISVSSQVLISNQQDVSGV